MKYITKRCGIRVVPETELDVAYIEDTLGLKQGGDAITLVRQDVMNGTKLVDLTTKPFPNRKVNIVSENNDTPVDKVKAVDLGPISYGHPAIDEIMQWFAYKQLPANLQAISKPVGELAHEMAFVGSGPELTAGLRHLLEAKDCFVRAAIHMANNSKEDDNG